ncbi:hypothetical protein [Luteolibacter marinus]|uniref:hypothetical protein n=1 Tax=Luteolibacter marinus TaxID=2776705 RepID=UPI0018665C43|nr:hypothetical protein [Luteolibacter marinus]
MNRLVRIALTLFIAASVLILLVLKRLERAKEMIGSQADSEVQMAYFGMGIVALMMIGGIVLLITAWVRSRKKPAGNE